MCGGSCAPGIRRRGRLGLSPRVRGKRSGRGPPSPPARSIPACAGEAQVGQRIETLNKVYPRVCGGSHCATFWPCGWCGLSPRVRGKHRPPRYSCLRHRSIPACAGEAPASPAAANTPRVYPRVCGGSEWTSGQPIALPRSIPACAGEAWPLWPNRTMSRVYPRVCGGSFPPRFRQFLLRGLSPRVRGKLPAPLSPIPAARSIPACAGEARTRPSIG